MEIMSSNTNKCVVICNVMEKTINMEKMGKHIRDCWFIQHRVNKQIDRVEIGIFRSLGRSFVFCIVLLTAFIKYIRTEFVRYLNQQLFLLLLSRNSHLENLNPKMTHFGFMGEHANSNGIYLSINNRILLPKKNKFSGFVPTCKGVNIDISQNELYIFICLNAKILRRVLTMSMLVHTHTHIRAVLTLVPLPVV